MDSEMRSRRDTLSWAAGLLEGEGYFTTAKRGGGRWTYLQIGAAMTDKDVILRLQKFFRLGKVYSYQPKRAREQRLWRWLVYNKDARKIMLRVLPYMGSRRSRRIHQLLSGDFSNAK
jgi:hypothetical protein